MLVGRDASSWSALAAMKLSQTFDRADWRALSPFSQHPCHLISCLPFNLDLRPPDRLFAMPTIYQTFNDSLKMVGIQNLTSTLVLKGSYE